MQMAGKLEYKSGTREELLPGFDMDFPCISSCYLVPEGDAAPWHWHPAVELFYIEKGCLEYVTPSRRHIFHTGTGGVLMPNVPHMTRGYQSEPGDRQLLHLFDQSLISGQRGSRIEEKYVLPLMGRAELVILDPRKSGHRDALELIRESFRLAPEEEGYELLLRDILSRIWLKLCVLASDSDMTVGHNRTTELIRQMMIYIHGHYGEKLSVETLARSVNISQRLCYKLFQKHLHMTPMDYVNGCRIRVACRMLTQTEESITDIATACGFRSGSYFTHIFRQSTGKTPREYRKNAQQEEMP